MIGSTAPERIETVVLDMAGTTVRDDGMVEEAFALAWERRFGADRADEAMQWVRDTMGRSKIEVFRHLVAEDDAQALNVAFEAAFDDLVAAGRAVAIPGAEAAIRALQAGGRTVVLTTGFSRPTAEAILEAIGWSSLPDAVLTPADAGRGRPAPDLNLLAVMRARTSSVRALAVVGDTESDIASALAAGAGLAVGVLTGTRSDADFVAAGADRVIASVAELPELLARLGR
jgi:phosphonatase-like hydrolase